VTEKAAVGRWKRMKNPVVDEGAASKAAAMPGTQGKAGPSTDKVRRGQTRPTGRPEILS
jgi:hypothetical protein